MRTRKNACAFILAILTICIIIRLQIGDVTSKRSLNDCNIQIRNTYRKLAATETTRRTSRTTLQIVTSIPEYDKELSFNNFSYPLDVDMVKLIQDFKRTGKVRQRAINNFTQRFLHNPVNRCYNTAGGDNTHTGDIFLLFVVKSKNDHFDQRDAIRETWGNELYLKKFIIKTVFILGTPVNESLKPTWSEIKEFNDIILMDFHDTYFNNTLKTSTSFNWVPEFCPQARFVVLVDDDIYVSLETLVMYLDRLPEGNRVNLYAGRAFLNANPYRNTTSKWYVPVSEYPWDTYPPFVTAGTVIMTMDFVSDVRIAMRYTKPFRLDDIYVALIAHSLGVVPLTVNTTYGHPVMWWHREFKDVISTHGYTPKQLRFAWTKRKSMKIT